MCIRDRVSTQSTWGTSVLTKEEVEKLVKELYENCDDDVLQIIQNMHFVGCADAHHIFIQFDQHLLMMNTIPLIETMCFQFIMQNLENLETISFPYPRDLSQLIKHWLRDPKNEFSQAGLDPDEALQGVLEILEENSPFLARYFGIIVRNGMLSSFSDPLKLFLLNDEDIADALIRIALNTNFEDRYESFVGVSKTISHFVAWSLEREALKTPKEKDDFEKEIRKYSEWYLARVTPFLKTKTFPNTKSYGNKDAFIIEAIKLQDLYKVFERCQTIVFICSNSFTSCIMQNQTISERVLYICLLYTSPSPRDGLLSRMPSSA
eukprot:TRINITY_DN8223_c0_g1_i2.p1 TRINITY_DN8223_c0_g1~~TRINITY_DN8223_c0_g1_i2.p1  ORF type:complete len:321 (-),score=52.10 TRINITY_DN8223_c0_g1_i2:11-973(-)